MVNVGLGLIVSYEQGIIFSVVVFERGRPLALSLGVPAATEIIYVIILQDIEDITYNLPMDKVPGMHYWSSGAEVHSGADHIEVITCTEHVYVRYVGISQRVDTYSSLRLAVAAHQNAAKQHQ